MKLTFKGQTHRVQLAVWDFRDDPYCTKPEDKKLSFSVSILSASAKSAASFSSGKTLYYGESFPVAWALVLKYAHGTKVPMSLKKYAIERDTLSRMSVTNSPKMPTVVNDHGQLREWVGIGWIDIKQPPSGREPVVIG